MGKVKTKRYAGIDVQLKRPCALAVLDERNRLVQSGWHATAEELFCALEPLTEAHQLHIGIDAPRRPLMQRRDWYWDGARCQWRRRRTGDRGVGRHCEVAVRALGLANPQWTPLEKDAPEWMRLGFRIFRQLERLGTVCEAFPSAAYRQTEGDASLRVTVDFSALRPGPKDMLDAWMAAATVREFVEGRGMEVGDGDGLGSIILPRPVALKGRSALDWPTP